MLSQKQYQDRLIEWRSDHINFVNIHQSVSIKEIVYKLANDFEMIFSFKAMCARLLDFSYRDHAKLRVLAKEMASLDLPSLDQWK